MATTSTVDISTLGWVKTEIDESLRQARQSLEAYAGNPGDDSQLRFCTTHLHQVVGTLEMVELDGAAMLAKEIEALAEAILSDELKPDEHIYDVLIRGILTLPDYLARLQFGNRDVPLRLLPLLNELRTVRNTSPISELELFNPDLTVRPPRQEQATKGLSPDEYRAMARKLRPIFQVALLAWLRDTGSTQAMNNMVAILDQLEQEANLGVVEQLFWVASGLLEAMMSSDLEPTNERKKLLARLDQQIRKLVEGAGKTDLRSSTEALVKSILFHVATAKTGSPKVTQLKQAFDLDLLLGNVAAEPEPDLSELPTPEILQSVSTALVREIEAAQDVLAAYFDPEQEAVDSLEPLDKLLGKMSSTMDMLDVPILKSLVDALRQACEAITDGKLEGNETVSMAMASALLLIESSSRDIHASATDWKRQLDDATAMLRGLASGGDEGTPSVEGLEVSDAELTESDYKQLLNVVADEIRVNLANIEEVIEIFVADTSQTGQMEHVMQHLGQIQGALQILGQDSAARLAEKTAGYVEDISKGVLAPDEDVMDPLAVCIGTIGAYVDGLQFNRPNLDALVDLALQEMELATSQKRDYAANPSALLEVIHNDLSAWLGDRDDSAALNNLQQHLQDMTLIASQKRQEKLGKISQEMLNLLQIVADDPSQLTAEVIDTLNKSLDTLAGIVSQTLMSPPQAEVVPIDVARARGETISSPAPAETTVRDNAQAAAPVSAQQATGDDDDDFDEEIMEIFIEDARDSLDTINKNFPLWREDTGNRDTMFEVRRAFHTIKGSGRMVGASEIAEFSWSVESILNKIGENKIAPTEEIFEHIEEVRGVLPDMIAQLGGGPAVTADIEGLRVKGHELADGNNEAQGDAESPSRVAEVDMQVNDVGDIPRADATLLQIFISEAQGHVGTIEEGLAGCEQSGSCFPSAGLIRAAHTLSGSARSVGLLPMSDACKAMEKLLLEMEAQQIMLGERHLGLLEEIRDCVGAVVDELSDRGNTSRVTSERFNEITKRVISVYRELETSLSADLLDVGSVAVDAIVVDEGDPIPTVAQPITVQGTGPDATGQIKDHLDADLIEIFYEEAVDILHTINEAVARWHGDLGDRSAVEDLKRALHTFKGGARMSGAMSLGELAHHTETMLGRVEQGLVQPDAELLDLLDEIHDTLAAAIEQVRNGQPASGVDALNARLGSMMSGGSEGSQPAVGATQPDTSADLSSIPVSAVPHEDPPIPAYAVAESTSSRSGAVSGQRPAADAMIRGRRKDDTPGGEDAADRIAPQEKWERREQIRVRTDLLNELANYAGEVSISRSRMEQQIYGFNENITELQRSVTRFREQLRELEIQSESQILYRAQKEGSTAGTDFDPLEFDRFSKLQQLSRGLTEGLHDLSTIQTNLGNFASEAESVLQQQARVNTELQEGLMRTRMVDFNTQAARLRHIVRQTARELGKNAQLEITGGNVEVDRNVLERMIAPFEHMVRNALDHGIESEKTRKRLGKPKIGKITIDTRNQGNEIIMRFSDDGAGLDIAEIRDKAIERGLMPVDAALSEEETMQFILVSGFSTADHVTHISGRGVGMDVVHNEVRQLGGTMSVDTEKGAGTTFVIRLPLTLSITQALMVYAGDQMFALSLSSIINILEIPTEELTNIYVGDRPLLNHNDQVYPFMSLASHLGIVHGTTASTNKAPVLLGRSGSREVAMQVDGLVGTREIVIKPLSAQLNEVKGLAGATILGDGKVVLILDIASLWMSDDMMHVTRAAAPVAAERAETKASRRPAVMIVDDSLTVRKITTKYLQKLGIEAITAKDGLDAAEQLRERVPNLMLVDIEMPRMDGYELTKRVRSDPALKHIPIIMITSRAGIKHKDKAMELGVNVYMSKPYQEDELTRSINELLNQ